MHILWQNAQENSDLQKLIIRNITNEHTQQNFAFLNFSEKYIELLKKNIPETQTQTKNEIRLRKRIKELSIKNACRTSITISEATTLMHMLRQNIQENSDLEELIEQNFQNERRIKIYHRSKKRRIFTFEPNIAAVFDRYLIDREKQRPCLLAPPNYNGIDIEVEPLHAPSLEDYTKISPGLIFFPDSNETQLQGCTYTPQPRQLTIL